MFAMPRGGVVLVTLVALAVVHPRVANAAEAAEVTCKDGTTSKGGKGACSGHGGVDKSAPGAAAAATTTGESKSKSTSKHKEAAAEETDQAGTKPSAKASPGTASSAASAEAAEVTCKDGTTSKGGKGACSGHGGIDKGHSATTAASAPASPAPAAPVTTAGAPATTAPATSASAAKASAAGKGPPTATCKDGTLSYAQHHTGACSNHGGVAEWLDGTQK